jgi:phosphoribosylamine--glycine ligase
MAAHGYPGRVRTGDAIRGIEECAGMAGRVQVFQAGVRMGAKGLETAGGRVLGVTASGEDLKGAMANAYAAVEKIHFAGAHWRRDIGAKGLKRW